MLYAEYISITRLCFHLVGNKLSQDNVVLAKKLMDINTDMEKILLKYFLQSFNFDEYFHLFHESDLPLNEVYTYVSKIFDNPENLYEQSGNLAKHLYNQSVHPKIKGGEFYVVYVKDCIVDGDTVDAVGLFKSENKDTFLKVLRENGNFNLESEQGINIKKLDKGCLIFNKERESGYVVAVVDNTNKGVEAQYWIEDFLHVRSRKNEYSNTQNIMAMAKTFFTKDLPKEFEISKKEQIDLLNRSLQYFKGEETFDMDAFTHQVIMQPEMIERFHHFKQHYEDTNNVEIDSQFAISGPALQKQQRSYKRTIRLDKKIQIIIDGNSDNVEQGRDTRGKFYKVYYNEED